MRLITIVQASVNGEPARDIASHFVQRWNHHRLSTSTYSEPILTDITNNMYVTSCARCKTANLFEMTTQCPSCGYDLGPCNSYSNPAMPFLLPPTPDTFSFILFECPFGMSIPLKFGGDCPVLVVKTTEETTGTLTAENMVSNEILRRCGMEPRIVRKEGPHADQLESVERLTPSVGDIVYSIDGVVVTHLAAAAVKRLLKLNLNKRKQAMEMNGAEAVAPIAIVFRRFYSPQPHYESKKEKEPENLPKGELSPPASEGLTEQDVLQLCHNSAEKEVLMSISLLTHVDSASFDLLPRLYNGTGSCHVQVLRSVGKWSIGTKTECSIMNAWVETIKAALKFIYIENQFFIGNLAGCDVTNSVPRAIAERIVEAYQRREVRTFLYSLTQSIFAYNMLYLVSFGRRNSELSSLSRCIRTEITLVR